MNPESFTVWAKPDSGPLSVQERDETGTFWVWLSEAEAVQRARVLKHSFPHMDFVVRKEDAAGCASIFLDTSRDAAQ